MKKLLIYMPTYGRAEIAFEQAKRVAIQIKNINKSTSMEVYFMIVINSDKNYRVEQFLKYAHCVINREDNIEASLNALMAFKKSTEQKFDFLWIIGDDEPIAEFALETIQREISANRFDLLIGSNREIGKLAYKNSYQKLSWATGGTNSFIASTVFRCDLIEPRDIEYGFDFIFTKYPHLVILNRIIERNKKLEIYTVPLSALCCIDNRVFKITKLPRNNFGYGDSIVFFGKPLTIFAAETHRYKRKELYFWWSRNWHRVDMFRFERDFRYELLCLLSRRYFLLLSFICLGALPFWRIKDIIRPLKIK